MKKLITIIGVLASTGIAQAQSDSRFYNSEGEYKAQVEARGPGTGGGIDGPDDPAAPIDDYIPMLLIAGLGMAAFYARKRSLDFNRS